MHLKLFFIGLLAMLTAGTIGANDRPNFVFILTDDQSFGMMGCDGNELTQTPNIDRLAEDPAELHNLIDDKRYTSSQTELRDVWRLKIVYARGTESPKVLRYTKESALEKSQPVSHQ